jgi:uncharacterized protein (TIGR02231 family)
MVSGQAPMETTSTIKKVTVYPQGAQIERTASVAIPQGQSVVRLTGLSPYIRPTTIRIEGDGTFTILNVQHQNDYLNELSYSKEIQEIREKIDALKIKTEDEELRIKIAREKLEFLNANKNIGGKDKAVDPEIFKSLNAIYGNNVELLNLEILKRQRETGELQKEITRLSNQLNALNNKAQLPSGIILVSVESRQPGNVKINFSYMVDNASWSPTYDIRFTSPDKPLTIAYKANIIQNTGIDWKGVKLLLSTASTSQSAQIPLFSPWYLTFYEVQSRFYLQEVNTKSSESYVDMDMVTAPAAMPTENLSIPVTSVNNRVTSSEYVVEIPQNIRTSAENNTLKYLEREVDAQFEYQAIPKMAENVYLIGRIPDWYKTDLQDGEVNVYLENSYVGKSSVNTREFGDTLSISFGIDNNISIKRKKLTDFTENQFIGSNRKETKGYRITCRNNKSYPVTVKVTDQIPVSTHKDIQVEALELSGGTLEPETGKITWNLKLKEGEARDVIIKYSVKYPKEKRVIVE